MEENRLNPKVFIYGSKVTPKKETVPYDDREYKALVQGCNVTVRFRRTADTELAHKALAPLMTCFEERVSTEKTA